jgi:hypothetical protein
MSFTQNQRPATQAEVLDGVIALLRGEFSDWDETAIYWTDTDTPPTDMNLSKFLTVIVGSGQYDQGALDGGPLLLEDMQFAVKIWHRSETDQTGRNEVSLFADGEGMLYLKRRVLKSLMGKMLYDTDDIQIAIETIHPLSAGEPRASDSITPLDSLAIAFGVKFEWSLS